MFSPAGNSLHVWVAQVGREMGWGWGEMGIWRGVQKCTEEGGIGGGGRNGTTFCFCSSFLIKTFNEHVKVFTMICIYYLSVKLLFENSLHVKIEIFCKHGIEIIWTKCRYVEIMLLRSCRKCGCTLLYMYDFVHWLNNKILLKTKTKLLNYPFKLEWIDYTFIDHTVIL